MTLLSTTATSNVGVASLKLGLPDNLENGPHMAHDGAGRGTPRSGPLPLPHIDDITARPKDIDHNQSMKRLIEDAETSLKSAETSRGFNRPATALKDYVRASIIAIVTVKTNPDYPTLQHGRPDLLRRHRDILAKIDSLHPKYETIKREIKADNERTGVRPTVIRPTSLTQSSPGPDMASQKSWHQPSNSLDHQLKNTTRKLRPTVHPKPQSLHGNAIHNSIPASISSSVAAGAQDIASRIAALGGPRSSPGQDPRIKTHHISQAQHKPAGPREMPPPTSKSNIGIDCTVPLLPKIPDAIYSPVRASIPDSAARLPASNSQRFFSRTGSTSSVNSNINIPPQLSGRGHAPPTPTKQAVSDSYAPRQSSAELQSRISSPRRSLDISPGDTLTPNELYQLMKDRISILIIDIRTREDFDEGHIYSTSTICIEPTILMRGNISCEDISESLILSPNSEQSVFNRRNEYDLVVMYDKESERIPKTPLLSNDFALEALYRALVHLNYDRELRHPPRLLKGGVDAWKDLLGPLSLRSTSKESEKNKITNTNTLQPVQRTLGRRNSKYVVRPLKEEDAKAWQETVTKDDRIFYQTAEEFITKYPPIVIEPESMTSPVLGKAQLAKPALPSKASIFGDLPPPPTRPVPVIQRSSYSGYSSRQNDKEHTDDVISLSAQGTGRGPKGPDQPFVDSFKFYTGLNNPGNWCYANSVLQALLASHCGKELSNPSEWKEEYRVPKKDSEKMAQPQLMTQILSNLFHWMSSGQFDVMKAHTLMGYSQHVSKQERCDEIFGDNTQHDAQEFMSFVLSHLDDETNRRRNQIGAAVEPDVRGQSFLAAAMKFWENHSFFSDSIVDKYWRAVELTTTICHSCNTHTYKWSISDIITCNIGNEDISLERALANRISGAAIPKFQCDTCRDFRPATKSDIYARMPPTLCVVFSRFGFDPSTQQYGKSLTRITWDLDDLDMSPYFLRPSNCPSGVTSDRNFSGPFKYECFAVVEHMGGSPNVGHYTAYVRNPRDVRKHGYSSWLYCNDSGITKLRMDPGETRKVFKDGNRVPYFAFFRRKDRSY